MFKAIREFFFGKPAQAPEAEAPYKVEPAAPEAFTPPPKAAAVAESIPAIVKVETVEAKPVAAKKPVAKKPAAKPAQVKKPAAKKPVAK
jgi:translation initiation factor IF-3